MKKIFYGEQKDQYGELRIPEGEGPHPVAVVIHGGFWREPFTLELMTDAAEDLTAHGYATWNIEYRRVGQDDGAWPNTLLDVGRAHDYVKNLAQDYNLDIDKTITIGHSAGGHLAMWLAGRHKIPATSELYCENPHPVAGAISLAGVVDPETMYTVHHFRDASMGSEPNNPVADLLKGKPEEVRERLQAASPLELLPIEVPHVLIHGSLDIHVPIGISSRYQRHAEELAEFVKFVELTEAEHFMLTDTKTEAWEAVLEEVDLLLKSI
ncbi:MULTISPECIES: alpha/beta hydrolase family protein [Pontibacillus]|uniref:Alpha/beta hydrolase n=1 Tax=Pontibacillus chungwhensis TaxID=265426 RepID=A0ABY8V3X1_9BACI|nr:MULTISPECIES: alpha/beta hydrolase [Pontibacillus]MCD5325416.1 alpha/beta fold hydrolase [Pontibacillus sp. HN14]WIF98531.1 alpha/beta hydrolase [Pontibacillus chungwhensis]